MAHNTTTNLVSQFITSTYRDWQTAYGQPSDLTPPLLVAVNGPQGSGKTTLCRNVCEYFGSLSPPLHTIAISLDDFYLTHAHQDEMYQHSTRVAGQLNPLLRYRGNPGTHDVALGLTVLKQLKNINSSCHRSPRSISVPRYNKAAHWGRGDRYPVDQWTQVQAPVHIILLEGWMIGFRALPDEAVVTRYRRAQEAQRLGLGPDDNTNPDLIVQLARYELEHVLEINRHLTQLETQWYPLVDSMICLTTDDLRYVYTWRLEQERSLSRELAQSTSADQGVLTEEQVKDFVDRFMPAYLLYQPTLSLQGFFGQGARPSQKQLVLKLDKQWRLRSSDTL
ncbi:hypothetical protein IWQ61_006354 [Dispira simplex]|nr:hypothetical protein IWQ61_006354 [Dispira simplex]